MKKLVIVTITLLCVLSQFAEAGSKRWLRKRMTHAIYTQQQITNLFVIANKVEMVCDIEINNQKKTIPAQGELSHNCVGRPVVGRTLDEAGNATSKIVFYPGYIYTLVSVDHPKPSAGTISTGDSEGFNANQIGGAFSAQFAVDFKAPIISYGDWNAGQSNERIFDFFDKVRQDQQNLTQSLLSNLTNLSSEVADAKHAAIAARDAANDAKNKSEESSRESRLARQTAEAARTEATAARNNAAQASTDAMRARDHAKVAYENSLKAYEESKNSKHASDGAKSASTEARAEAKSAKEAAVASRQAAEEARDAAQRAETAASN